MLQRSSQLKHLIPFMIGSRNSNAIFRDHNTLAHPTALTSQEKVEYPVLKRGFEPKQGLISVQPSELETRLKQANQPSELFDILLSSSAFFQPHHLEGFVKHLTLLACYNRDANKYTPSSVSDMMPPEVNRVLVKQIIKLAPYFEYASNIDFVERLVLLGFGSEDLCVKGIIQLLKHQINSFGNKYFLVRLTLIGKMFG